MEATNIPQAAAAPVVTFWEGEIVDNLNHTFLTQKWGATRCATGSCRFIDALLGCVGSLFGPRMCATECVQRPQGH